MQTRPEVFTHVLLILLAAAILAGCPAPTVRPDPADTVQQAYALRDSLIIAKQALYDLRVAELGRRAAVAEKRVAPGPSLLTDATFTHCLTIANQADAIIKQVIAVARGPSGTGAEGFSAPNLLIEAQLKINEIAKVNGGKQ